MPSQDDYITNDLTIYLQGPGGEEIELIVTQPNPDGTYHASLPTSSLPVVLDSTTWIRICPNKTIPTASS